LLVLDVTSMDGDAVCQWMNTQISGFAQAIDLPAARAEALLVAHQWDAAAAREVFIKDPSAALEGAHMGPVQPVPYVYKGDGADMCMICGDTMEPPAEAGAVLASSSSGSSGGGPVKNAEKVVMACAAGHAFCLECVSTFICTHIREGTGVGLACPGYQCAEMLDDAWAAVVFREDPALRARRDALRRERVVDCAAALRSCQDPNCSQVICGIPVIGPDLSPGAPEMSLAGMPRTVHCGAHHHFCLKCNQPSHAPSQCDDAKEWQGKVNEQLEIAGEAVKNAENSNDLANALWLAANTRPCPRCSTPIEKDEGCNHMTCRKCRYDFCWICREPWKLHTQATGGYFQCNRFTDVEAVIGAGGDSRWSGVDAVGSSHAEAQRAALRNKQMAQFIHYYTRYKAHTDSLALEMRLEPETIARLRSTLHCSVPRAAEKSSLTPLPPSSDTVGTPSTAAPSTPPRSAMSQSPGTPGSIRWLQGVTVVHPLTPSPEKTVKSSPVMSPAVEGGINEGDGDDDNDIEDPLAFLREGFRELVSCRLFLQGCYIYAFFSFTNIRRNHVLEARKREFETIQGELEHMVEMLSDSLARRRLRASKDQITQLMRAARSKRLELEAGNANPNPNPNPNSNSKSDQVWQQRGSTQASALVAVAREARVSIVAADRHGIVALPPPESVQT